MSSSPEEENLSIFKAKVSEHEEMLLLKGDEVLDIEYHDNEIDTYQINNQ